MQDRHQGRRTTRASFAMTQNPAAFLHLQHACMDSSPPRTWLPARSGESVPGWPGSSPVALRSRPSICRIFARPPPGIRYPEIDPVTGIVVGTDVHAQRRGLTAAQVREHRSHDSAGHGADRPDRAHFATGAPGPEPADRSRGPRWHAPRPGCAGSAPRRRGSGGRAPAHDDRLGLVHATCGTATRRGTATGRPAVLDRDCAASGRPASTSARCAARRPGASALAPPRYPARLGDPGWQARQRRAPAPNPPRRTHPSSRHPFLARAAPGQRNQSHHRNPVRTSHLADGQPRWRRSRRRPSRRCRSRRPRAVRHPY